MRNFKGAIFDLDGTLIDSMWVWREVDDTYLKSKGKIPEKDISRKLAAKGMMQSVAYFQQEYGINEPADQMAAELWSLAEYAYRYKVPLKIHVYNFLLELHRRGISMVVATASDKAFTEAALARLGILHFFEGIVTCDEIGKGKTEPDVYYAAQAMLHLPKQEIMVFEDALHAIETAKQAGFYVVGVYEPHQHPDLHKIKAAADCYIHSFLEFPFEKERNI